MIFDLFERGIEFLFDDLPQIGEKIVDKTIEGIDNVVEKILDL